MPPTASAFVAAGSCLLLLAAPVAAARRPRYGGTLRIQMGAAVASPDPAIVPPDSRDAAAAQRVLSEVFETLVRLDDKGEPQPLLATGWTHDTARKRWVFALRTGVMLHNGQPWEPPGGSLTVDDRRPLGEILRSLADPRSAVVVRLPDGTLAGTGPFRIVKWDGASAALQAHDGYWGGRPYLDQVEIRMRRSPRDQSLDLDVGKADVIELPAPDVRRLQQRGGRVALSLPVDVLALVADPGAPPAVETALSLAIDRAAIYNVLLQRTGNISGGLLPNWLGGYSFLFPVALNLVRARELASATPPVVGFAYDARDPMLRSIAERIMLNAGEAGIVLRPASGGAAPLRLVVLRVSIPDAPLALQALAEAVGAPQPVPVDSNPDQLYAAESAILRSRRVVPLFHLPAAYQLGPAVHGWPLRGGSTDRWRLEEVWLDERGTP